MFFSDREITKRELQSIYDDFKKIEVQDGVEQKKSDRYNIVAEQDGVLTAFASGLVQHSLFYLSDLWVHENYRRQGFGSKILSMLEEKVKGTGILYIYTWTTGPTNSLFYEKRGYRIFTIFEDFCGIEGYHKIGYRKDF